MPAAPTGLPVAPVIAAAETPDVDVALNDEPAASRRSQVPAATYPPRASSPPFVETDPDGAIAQGDRHPEGALGSRARMDETPRPGAKGTLFAPVVDGPQIAGRVVNPYGKPEPNASIQIFDLSHNRRLVAETAAGADGRFRAQNLEPGRQYEIAAASTATANRLFGSTVAVPPDGSAVVRLEPEHRSRTGSTFGSLEKLPGAKALQGLVKAPNPEPQPISDNVRISGPRLVAAGRMNTSTSEESELTNAVAQERPPVMTEPVKLPSVGERTRELRIRRAEARGADVSTAAQKRSGLRQADAFRSSIGTALRACWSSFRAKSSSSISGEHGADPARRPFHISMNCIRSIQREGCTSSAWRPSTAAAANNCSNSKRRGSP